MNKRNKVETKLQIQKTGSCWRGRGEEEEKKQVRGIKSYKFPGVK